MGPYLFAFCEVCAKYRKHFKGECLVCFLHETAREEMLEKQRKAHPEVEKEDDK